MSVYELIIRFSYNKCRKGYIWCTDGSFIKPIDFKSSTKLKIAYGYALTDDTVVGLKKSESVYDWYNSSKIYCIACNNAGKSGYCPDKYELSSLCNSIMSGKMRKDLITARVYGYCNYRESSISSSNGWSYIWSRDELDFDFAYRVSYDGSVGSRLKSSHLYALPFFKF